jgi:hypothetical protein
MTNKLATTAWTLTATAMLAAAAAWAASVAGNLVPNPGLEEGTAGGPAGWERPDNIALFWDSSGNPGKCLVFDTRISADTREKKAEAEKKSHTELGVLPPPTRDPRTAVQEKPRPKLQGVGAWGSPIPVEPGNWYVLDADVWGPAASKPSICIRGYRRCTMLEANGAAKSWYFQISGRGAWFEDATYGTKERVPVAMDYLLTLRYNIVLEIPSDGGRQWQHFRHAFLIPAKPKTNKAAASGSKHADSFESAGKVDFGKNAIEDAGTHKDDPHPEYRTEFVLLHPYALQPAGLYRFDNITLRRVSAEEAAQVLRDLNQEAVKW